MAIWRHIETVLAAAGATMDDVVKVFQFVVGKENFAGYGPGTEGCVRGNEAASYNFSGCGRACEAGPSSGSGRDCRSARLARAQGIALEIEGAVQARVFG